MWGDRHQQAILLIELTDAGLKDLASLENLTTLKVRLEDLDGAQGGIAGCATIARDQTGVLSQG